MIEARHIDFAYGKKAILHDISFELKPGSLCGILGSNGSGKTTLLKCLLGILPVKNGLTRINGKDLAALPPGKRAKQAAYVPQDTKNYSTCTVFENVLLGRKPHFGSAPSERDYTLVSEALTELDLEDLAMRPVQTLSGGQRQRMCIAKALCQETPVIFLDEPTANLDIRYKMEVMQILRRLAGRGKTVVFSVHDLSIPRAFCSDILLLKEGRVVARGGPDVLTEKNIEKLYDVDFELIRSLVAGHTVPPGSPVHDNHQVLSLCRKLITIN